MKFLSYLLFSVILLSSAIPVFAQKYKTPADTVKLNEEYLKIKNDIVDLTAQLTVAQNNLPGYQSKANTAGLNAQTSAATSNTDASKATNGNISDAKTARNAADDSYNAAKDARNANDKVGNQNEKINKLTEKLDKKNKRLKELDVMRASIYAQLPANLHP